MNHCRIFCNSQKGSESKGKICCDLSSSGKVSSLSDVQIFGVSWSGYYAYTHNLNHPNLNQAIIDQITQQQKQCKTHTAIAGCRSGWTKTAVTGILWKQTVCCLKFVTADAGSRRNQAGLWFTYFTILPLEALFFVRSIHYWAVYPVDKRIRFNLWGSGGKFAAVHSSK